MKTWKKIEETRKRAQEVMRAKEDTDLRMKQKFKSEKK